IIAQVMVNRLLNFNPRNKFLLIMFLSLRPHMRSLTMKDAEPSILNLEAMLIYCRKVKYKMLNGKMLMEKSLLLMKMSQLNLFPEKRGSMLFQLHLVYNTLSAYQVTKNRRCSFCKLIDYVENSWTNFLKLFFL